MGLADQHIANLLLRKVQKDFHGKNSVEAGMVETVRIDRPEEPEAEPIPDDVPLPELAEQVVRGKVRLSPPQLRMLIELLPFYLPKLSATTIATIDGKSFAEALDRCIERSIKGPP
jgi:hypothetical protein